MKMETKRHKAKDEIDLDEVIEDIMKVKSVERAYTDGYYTDQERMYHETKEGNALHFIKKEDAYGIYLISMEEVSKNPSSRYEVVVYDPSVQLFDCENLTYLPMIIMTKSFTDEDRHKNRSDASGLVMEIRKNRDVQEYIRSIEGLG